MYSKLFSDGFIFFEFLILGGTPFSIGKGPADTGTADGVDAGRMELASPMVVDAGLYFITSDAYHRHRNKIMRTLASMRHTIVFGSGSAADKLRTLFSITKEYKFDAENFHFIKDA